MIIKAKKQQSIEDLNKIAQLMYEIYYASGSELFKNYDQQNIKIFIKQVFIEENHFFSYENCFIFKDNNEVKGIIIVYLDEAINKLWINSLNLMQKVFTKTKLTPDDLGINQVAVFNPNNLYIDLISVSQNARGQGIGTKLIEYICHYYENDKKIRTISLQVSHNNPQAKKLYYKLKFIDDKTIFINKTQFDVMVRKI